MSVLSLAFAVGNRRFRILCELNLHKYEAAQSKTEKSVIVMSIVDAVREAAGIGGFVRQVRFVPAQRTNNTTRTLTPVFSSQDLSSKQWFEVGDVIAREKVGQQLRDLMNKKGSTDSASSTQASKTTTLKPHAKNAPNRPPMTRSPPDSSEPQPKKRRSMGHRLSLASSSCDDSVDTTQSPVATADSHLFFDSSLLLNADFDEPVEAWEC